MYALGIAAFALCILASIAWHECGHMWAAQATGMKVRRYFIGFGPTLWSTRRPKGPDGIEYGVKALPLGGFCDIAGTLKSIAISPADLETAFTEGIGIDGSTIEGLTRSYESDMILRPDPATFELLAWRGETNATGRMMCDVLTPDGEPAPWNWATAPAEQAAAWLPVLAVIALLAILAATRRR